MSSTITLEVELHCMCLLVPDPDKRAVHVLMPCTGCENRGNRHIALLRYRGTDGRKYDRRLEGWALALGDPQVGTDHTTLTVPPSRQGSQNDGLVDGTVVELSRRGGTALQVPRRLLDQPDHSVVSRITFYGGEITAAKSQDSRWIYNDQTVSIASQVTWRMEIQPGQMVWSKLDPTERQRPLPSLGQVGSTGSDADQTLRLQVFHVTPRTLPRKDRPVEEEGRPDFSRSVLLPPEIRAHFAMFYGLLGLNDSRRQALPQLPKHATEDREVDRHDPIGGSPGWACLCAMAGAE